MTPNSVSKHSDEDHQMPSSREVFIYFLTLGFINIGGPVAQITTMFNHMVERKHWLSSERFTRIMAFCHMLPGPEALQLAIYVGYLKRRLLGGIVAGLTFIVPGAVMMIILSWLYVYYGSLPAVNNALSVLKPAVIGIISAGIIKLGRAAIKSVVLALLLVASFVGMRFFEVNLLVILLVSGFINLLLEAGTLRFRQSNATLPAFFFTLASIGLSDSRWLHMSWLFLKTGLFSFGGAYASLVFLQRGAVDQYQWLSSGQLLDGVALSMATPGPFMLFTTFVGYLAGGLPGAVLATFFVFLPSFVLVLGGTHYIERVRDNRSVQAFLTGVSAAVVGVILVVSLDLVPEGINSLASIVIAAIAFASIVLVKTDVALVAVGAMVLGIAYALFLAVW